MIKWCVAEPSTGYDCGNATETRECPSGFPCGFALETNDVIENEEEVEK